MTARRKWIFELASDEDVSILNPTKTASNYPVEYGTEESDGYCGNSRCGVILVQGLSEAGAAAKLHTEVPMLIICPQCLAQNLVPRQ
jgi:hypothetical protein